MSSFLDEVDSTPVNALDEVMAYVTELEQVRSRREELENELAEVKKRERDIAEGELPEYMLSHGLEKLSLSNGKTVSIKEDLTVKLPENETNRNISLAWLSENGAGELIKDELTVQDPDEALKEQLRQREIVFATQRSINTNSLKAWFRKKLGLSKGAMQEIVQTDVPKELNLYIFRSAEVK